MCYLGKLALDRVRCDWIKRHAVKGSNSQRILLHDPCGASCRQYYTLSSISMIAPGFGSVPAVNTPFLGGSKLVCALAIELMNLAYEVGQ